MICSKGNCHSYGKKARGCVNTLSGSQELFSVLLVVCYPIESSVYTGDLFVSPLQAFAFWDSGETSTTYFRTKYGGRYELTHFIRRFHF